MSRLFKAKVNSKTPNDAYRDNFDRIFRKDATKLVEPEERPRPSPSKSVPCSATIPGRGFADVSFCTKPKGHEGICW